MSADPTARVIAALESHDCKPKKSGDGWQSKCPAHDDRKASLSVGEGSEGKAILHCHAGCRLDDVISALNLEKQNLFPPRDSVPKVNGAHRHPVKQSSPPLSDAQVKAMAEALRKNANAWKHVTDVLRFTPDVVVHLGLYVDHRGRRWLAYPYRQAGAWTYANCRSLDGEKDFVRIPSGQKTQLYRVDVLEDGGTAILVEGERDAAAALTMNLHAELGGAGGAAVVGMPGVDQVEVAVRALETQRLVYLCTDNDQPGEVAAEKLATRLGPQRCRRVRVDGFKDLGDLLSAVGAEKGSILSLEAFRRADQAGPFGAGDRPEGDDHRDKHRGDGQAAAEEAGPFLSGSSNGASKQPAWEMPIPFAEHDAPPFPAEALPEWLGSYVIALATSTQTPVDLPAVLSLSVLATALARKARIALADDWTEPLNLFTAVVLPPGARKSAVFSTVTEPVEDFEREEAERLEPQRREAVDAYEVAQARLKHAREAAAKAKDENRAEALEEVKRCSQELAEMKVPVPFRLLADDCTPEKLSTLLRDHDGRMALLSPEGGVFELMAGRYSDAPNLEVYLKGHAGDDLRVDRVNRPAEFVQRPALTIGLAIQPDVLQGLKDKPGFRGRGLLGRFLYALPKNTVGFRDVEPPSVPPMVRAIYQRELRTLLSLPDGVRVLRLSGEAKNRHRDFMRELEPRLGPKGDLSAIADWAGKHAGAVGRIVGLLHLAEARADDERVSAETMSRALSIGRYLIQHAQAAFAEMGADPETEGAQRILAWLKRTATEVFTRRDAHQALRATFRQAADLDAPLTALEERGYIRRREEAERPGPGRRRSQAYEVHPILSQSSQSTEMLQHLNSEHCEDSVRRDGAHEAGVQ